jgi:hypothetical protein
LATNSIVEDPKRDQSKFLSLVSLNTEIEAKPLNFKEKKKHEKSNTSKVLFCVQLILCFTIPLLMISMHFLYEALMMCRYYGGDCSGLWLGINTNAAILIDIVLYSSIILQFILIMVCFYMYDSKKNK